MADSRSSFKTLRSGTQVSQTSTTTSAANQAAPPMKGSKSASHAGGASLARKRTRLSLPEKKIAEDEFMAAAIGDTEWLRQSLRGTRGAINFDKNGLAPIHLAAIHGRLECLQLLVEKFKVDVNLPSSSGWRPVHLVISNQTGKRAFMCLLYLLEQGADPSVTNADGLSPVHQAASEGHVQCLKLLIEVGANIDIQDGRGHTPMDLAKLWGHRKCARILAAEQWHQDKDFLSSEMKKLQKLKMQQVLKELEEDEEIKADQQFYGEIAFNQWLQKHGLSPGSADSESSKREKSSIKTPSKEGTHSSITRSQGSQQELNGKDSLSRANSIKQKTKSNLSKQPTIIEEQPQSDVTTPSKAMVVSRQDAEASRSLQPTPQSSKESTSLPGNITPQESKHETTEQEQKPKDGEAICNHPKPWNKSTKVPFPTYVSMLPDHYPHDEYTMLPATPPKRERSTLSAVLTEEQQKRQGASGSTVKMPKLPKEVIDKALSRKKDRTVIFKCKNIVDTQQRRKLDWERMPRSESGLHLCNDPNSRLFQNALLDLMPSTPSTGISGISDWSDDVGITRSDIPAILRFIKKVSKPGEFPDIRGVQYDYQHHDASPIY